MIHLPKSARIYLWLTVGLGVGAGLLTVLQAVMLARIIVRAFQDGQSLAQLGGLLGWFVGASIGRSLLSFLSQLTAQQIANHTKAALRTRLIEALFALGTQFTSGERSGELTNTLTVGLDALDGYLRDYLPQMYRSALIPLTILLFVFPLDLISALVLLVTAPLIPFFMYLIGTMADELIGRKFGEIGRMSAHFLDVLQGLTTLKLFNRSRQQVETIRTISAQFGATTMRVLRVAFLSTLVLELGATLSIALLAGEIGLRMLFGDFQLLPALTILILAPEFYMPLRTLGANYHAGKEGMTVLKRIEAILQSVPTAEEWIPAYTGMTSQKGDIAFENVSFAYMEGRTALDDVSLVLPIGKTTVLQGESGAGKSTLAALLLRFIAPTNGQICVSGIDLQEIDTTEWRSQIAWVSQRPFLFDGTVAENLRLGKATATGHELSRACQQANIHSFIQTLPNDYDTHIGERGTRLSAGQRQRLALARAFLQDAPLLILDEPTAHLDVENAADIIAAINTQRAGKTTLILTHQIWKNADQRLTLEDGKLIESLTFASKSAWLGS